MNAKEFAASIARRIKSHVADAVGPLREEIRDLREKFADQEHDGSLAEKEYAAIMSRIDAITVPKDGAPGKDADLGTVAVLIGETVAAAVKALPVPKDGTNGKDGIDGKPGPVGQVGGEGPIGPRGAAGDKGIDGRDGREGKDGLHGRDGIATTDELVKLVEVEVVKRLELEVARQMEIAIKSVPRMEFKYVWKPGEYTKGDCVQSGGDMWMCKAESTTEAPGGSADWVLVVRKGRDGNRGTRI